MLVFVPVDATGRGVFQSLYQRKLELGSGRFQEMLAQRIVGLQRLFQMPFEAPPDIEPAYQGNEIAGSRFDPFIQITGIGQASPPGETPAGQTVIVYAGGVPQLEAGDLLYPVRPLGRAPETLCRLNIARMNTRNRGVDILAGQGFQLGTQLRLRLLLKRLSKLANAQFRGFLSINTSPLQAHVLKLFRFIERTEKLAEFLAYSVQGL